MRNPVTLVLIVSTSPPVALRDRRRAVALAVHLVHAARLEARGHEEDVRAGLDQVRERFVEADEEADVVRVMRLQPVQLLHEVAIAGADHRDLRGSADELRDRLRQRCRCPSGA